MNNEIVQGLEKTYNEFLKIHTSGVDSFIYATCMNNLQIIIQYMNQQMKEENKEQEE